MCIIQLVKRLLIKGKWVFIIIKKIFSDNVPLVYSLLHLKNESNDFLVAASEEEKGSAYAYDLNNDFMKQEVWSDIGGTMTMVQIPGTLDFLATQKFYPGFNASACELVKLTFEKNSWTTKKMINFPYLHRFDLVEGENETLFIGTTITERKKSTDDWTSPGKIYVGEYNHEMEQLTNLHSLEIDLIKNHGYCAFKEKGYSLITSEDGVYQLFYPTKTSDWVLEKVYDSPVSDIAAIDTDQDNEFNYYLVINEFHGEKISILNQDFKEVTQIRGTYPFAHSIWGGIFNGKPCFIFGNREGKQDYYTISVTEDSGVIDAEFGLIDSQVGSTNTIVFQKDSKQYLVSANREIDQLAVYEEI